MFKKIEIWVLYLIVLFSLLIAVGFGVLVRQELVGNIKAGWLSKSALTLAEIPVNIKRILTNGEDHVIEDRFSNLSDFTGTPNDKELYLLLSRYDGDFKEGIVELIDLRNFQVLHTWNPDIDAFNDLVEQVDEFEYLTRDGNEKRSLLAHPKLTSDGGLLFGWEAPIRKINICSDLVYQNTNDIFHHSIETDSDGNIWAPSKLYPQTLPSRIVGRDLVTEGGFEDDAIVKLSSNGKIIYEKSVSQILIDNNMSYLLFSNGNSISNDPIHLNDIQPVNFDGEFWKKGDVFLSLRNLSMVMLYRPYSNRIIWMGMGPFLHQHDVDILDEHRISVFNNRSINNIDASKPNFVDGHNEVIIYDFKTNKYSSHRKDSLIKNVVKTVSQGRSEILPNDELFIEESNYGRTLFFNSDGSLRWTHVNRAENGNVYTAGWSRILYTPEDIQSVKKVLTNKGDCNE